MTPQPTCYCGTPIPTDGPSDLYCTPECQTRWLQKGHDYLPIPARPEWRMGASEGDWRRSMAWPDVPALPPQDVGQWIEDTDPAPVEPPPEPPSFEGIAGITAVEAARNMQESLASLPTMQDVIDFIEEHRDDPAVERARQQVADHLGVDVKRVRPGLLPQNGPALPVYQILTTQPERPGIIRRIANAAKRK